MISIEDSEVHTSGKAKGTDSAKFAKEGKFTSESWVLPHLSPQSTGVLSSFLNTHSEICLTTVLSHN